jgi:lysozyme
MKQVRRINQAGLELLKRFEGYRLDAYRDSKGIWTIGVGHTGTDVHMGLTITDQQALELLQKDLEHTYKIEAYLQRPTNDNQYSALVCLAFNIGTNAFKDSTLLHMINTG